MMNDLTRHLFVFGAALAIAASGCATGSTSTAEPEPLAAMPNGVVPGTAKVYALALPPRGSASGGDTACADVGQRTRRRQSWAISPTTKVNST